jgi:hypothetical protein
MLRPSPARSQRKCFYSNERWIASPAYTASLSGSVVQIRRRKVCQFG